ncbi:hypothetical protein HZB89_00510, partial [archaeon]|nr:hypothetical protein [archaeon]
MEGQQPAAGVEVPLQADDTAVETQVSEAPELTPVILVSSPSASTAGAEFVIDWKINALPLTITPPLTITHTAVHYGPESRPNASLPSDYASASQIQCAESACSIPSSFSTSMSIAEPGTYYYRAHAVIGVTHFWSEEKMIVIAQAPAVVESKTLEVSIQNYSFSPAELTIKKGDSVKWTNLDGVSHTATSDNAEVFD